MASNEDCSGSDILGNSLNKGNNGIKRMENEQSLERYSKVVNLKIKNDTSTSDSSQSNSNTEDSQQMARKTMSWSIEKLNYSILENLDELKDYSHKHFYLKNIEGRSHDKIIMELTRKVRMLTSRLVFGAEKMRNQISNLKRDNNSLRERLIISGKDNTIGSKEISYDFDRKITEHIEEKMDTCLLTIQEKVQLIIKNEIQSALKQAVVGEQANTETQIVPKRMSQSSNVEEGINRCTSDPVLSYAKIVGSNSGLEDLHQFPSLSKKRIRNNREKINFVSNIKCSNKSTSIPPRFQSNNINKVGSSVSSKRSKNDEVILLNILDNNINFSEVLSELKNKIDLKEDIGIEALRLRKTLKGGGIFIITGRDAACKADKLADNMSKVLCGKNIKVIRPGKNVTRKKAEIIISGRDDFVTRDEIVSAIVARGGCKTEEIQIGKFSENKNSKLLGRWSIYVKCPLTVGEILCKDGRLKIGWGWSSVFVAYPSLIRCYKCLRTGHTRNMCKEEEDRSLCCFKCGSLSHKIRDCDSNVYRCPLCMNINNKDSNHRLGDIKCICPSYANGNVDRNLI